MLLIQYCHVTLGQHSICHAHSARKEDSWNEWNEVASISSVMECFFVSLYSDQDRVGLQKPQFTVEHGSNLPLVFRQPLP